jgi:hypothetical protein
LINIFAPVLKLVPVKVRLCPETIPYTPGDGKTVASVGVASDVTDEMAYNVSAFVTVIVIN